MSRKKRKSQNRRRRKHLRRRHPGRGVYIITEWKVPNERVIYTQKSISGRYGKKDPTRIREKVSEDKVKKWQDKRAALMCYLLLEANFNPGDYFMRLSYPPKTKKSSKEVREDIKAFKKKLRRLYKKAGKELKMIFSVGRGKRGAIHLHIVANAGISSRAIEEAWQSVVGTETCPYPSCNTTHLDRSCNWPKLADYLIKNGLETFRSDDPIYRMRYVATRNLIKPEKTIRMVEANNWLEKPRAKKGYRVDYERLYAGYGITGFPFQSYAQVKLGIEDDLRTSAKWEADSGGVKNE